MYPLAHVAIGLLAGLLARRIAPRHAGPLPFWAFGALLPDLLDKPIALLVPGWDVHTRGIGHSLLFVLLLTGLGWTRPRLRATGLGGLTHLAADLPWTYHRTFLWPLRGPDFHTGGSLTWDRLWGHLTRPEILTAELLAATLALLVLLDGAIRTRRYRRAPQPLATLGDRVRRVRRPPTDDAADAADMPR